MKKRQKKKLLRRKYDMLLSDMPRSERITFYQAWDDNPAAFLLTVAVQQRLNTPHYLKQLHPFAAPPFPDNKS